MVDKTSSLATHIQNMKQTAVFAGSKNNPRAYRYLLTREWKTDTEKPNLACFIMQNPSTGDEYVDDPAIDECIKLVRKWDHDDKLSHDGIAVVNLYACVGSDSAKLDQLEDPIGPENDRYLKEAIKQYTDSIIIAWGDGTGNLPELAKRRRAVRAMLPKNGIYCLGTTENGQPRYPKPRFKSANTELHVQNWPRKL